MLKKVSETADIQIQVSESDWKGNKYGLEDHYSECSK